MAELDKERIFKYSFYGICLFLGAFLAFYFVAHQTIIRMYESPMYMMAPPPMHKMDRMMHKQMRDIRRMEREMNSPFQAPMMMGAPVMVQSFADKDTYKIIVDLSKFNNDEKNIKLDVNGNKVSVKGDWENDKKGAYEEYEFSQSFTLPQKINKNAISKKKQGDRYTITLPYAK